MKQFCSYLFLIALLGWQIDVRAQPANDNCSTATSLGTLPAPAACSGTGLEAGATVTLTNQTNVNATPSTPYPYISSCTPNVNSLPNDVWYSFVASSYQATISVSSATFTNPVITLWQGTCSNQASSGCVTGSGGAASLTVYQLVIGQTYYIQIAGSNATQNGTFTLKVHNDNDCSGCLVSSSLVATPPPVNGTYAPGQTVTFCLTVSSWDETNTNWLHGIQPSFGSGWNLASISPGTPPSSIDGEGAWAWYSSGVTSTATGTSWPAGFYYNSILPNSLSGGPGNSYGDDCNSLYSTCSWTFCVTITTNSACSPGSNLNATFYTSGDGESGAWGSVACSSDQPATADAVGSCCPPTMSSTATCSGSNSGTATATAVGTNSPWTFSWSNGTTQSGLTGPSTITGLASGTYTVTIVDHQDCSATATVSVASNAAPASNAGSAISFCTGGSGTIGANSTAGYTYSWSPSTGLSSNTASKPTVTLTNGTTNPVTDTYTVTTTNSSTGCTSSASVNVTVNPLPTVSITPGSLTCTVTTVTLTPTVNPATVTYSWAGGGTTTTKNVTTTGTYTVTVTNPTTTCSASASATVTQNITAPNASVAAPVTLTCSTTSEVLTASSTTGGATFNWGGGITTATKTVASTGTYTVTVTNPANGCTATASATVTQNITAPNASVAGPVVLNCTVTSEVLTASSTTGGATFNWGGGVTTATNTVSSPGTYTVTVTNPANGCTAIASATVTQNITTPNASVAAPVVLNCTVTSEVLTASSTTGGATFNWGGGITTATNTVSSPGTYTVTVTNPANGCTATASATVIQNITAPNASVAAPVVLTCSTTSEVLTASSTTGGATFNWGGGVTTATKTVASTGTYTVTVTNPVNGCTASAAAIVTQNITTPNASVAAPIVLNCTVTSEVLTTSSTTGGATFNWGGGITTATNTVSSPGTYTVTVTNPANGCTAIASATVAQNITPPNSSVAAPVVLN